MSTLVFSQEIDFTKVTQRGLPKGWRVSGGSCVMDSNITLSGTPPLKVDGHQAFVYSLQPLKYEASEIAFAGNVKVNDFRGEATVQVYSLGGTKKMFLSHSRLFAPEVILLSNGLWKY